jgi:hypothetical protein
MQTNTTDQFQVEHIEYVSDQPFDDAVKPRTGAHALAMIDRRRSCIAPPTPSSARPPESWTPSLRRSWSA